MSDPLQISVHVEEKRYQPTQEKTVVPDWDTKTVTPDRGYALSKVTVDGMPEPTESETFTANGTYNVGRIGTAIVDVGIDLQNKTITPTEQTQTVEADDGYDGLDTVTINPIPPEYVVPSGSVDITSNGTVPVSGKATANVNVPQGVFPSGTKVITENVTGEDVTNYAAVDVAVPGPSGTKQISITQNGTTTEDVSEYSKAEITVNTLPAKGLVFEDYDSDGYPHSAMFVGTWTKIYDAFLGGGSNSIGLISKIESINIPNGVNLIGVNAFRNSNIENFTFPINTFQIKTRAFSSTKVITLHFFDDVEFIGEDEFRVCQSLTTVIFDGNVNRISNNTFGGNTKIVLYVFSHCTTIPPLYSVSSLGHAPGCVIRIPAALSDTTLGEGNGWESATNWSALTDIVWEVV